MGDIRQLQYETLEFEGAARDKIERLHIDIAALWCSIRVTLAQFNESTTPDDQSSAHQANNTLRQTYVAKLDELEQLKSRAELFAAVFDAANGNRDELLATVAEGAHGTLIAICNQPSRIVAVKVQRRRSRIFGSDFFVLEQVGKLLRAA